VLKSEGDELMREDTACLISDRNGQAVNRGIDLCSQSISLIHCPLVRLLSVPC
jgi:hypothetical protein